MGRGLAGSGLSAELVDAVARPPRQRAAAVQLVEAHLAQRRRVRVQRRGQIAGGVLGGLVPIILIAFFGWRVWRGQS